MIRKVELKSKKLMVDVFFPNQKGIIKTKFGDITLNEDEVYAEYPEGAILLLKKDSLSDIFEIKKDKE